MSALAPKTEMNKFVSLVWLGRGPPNGERQGLLFGSADGADTSHWENGKQ